MLKAHAIISETTKKSLAPTEGQLVMPTLHYIMPTHDFQRDADPMNVLGSDGNHVSDLLSPSEFPLAHHLQMNTRGMTVYWTPRP